MTDHQYYYIIVGGGLAGASAVAGIREVDKKRGICLIAREPYLPYHRPPLTKGLWSGKKKIGEIFINKDEYYRQSGVDVRRESLVVSINTNLKTVTDSEGTTYRFEKLLLATGGIPLRLHLSGPERNGTIYYRGLDDYLKVASYAEAKKKILVIGGGFIGSELAAGLAMKNCQVTMLMPDPWPCSRLFPDYLGKHMAAVFESRGIQLVPNDRAVALEKKHDRSIVRTQNGQEIVAEAIVAGVGIRPSTELAQNAGLETHQGIRVNQFLQTSHPDIFAAGDCAIFPAKHFNTPVRIEHWDNALNQGKFAGANMAGAGQPYDYQPYFFSDLFDFGYEAVGDINSGLHTYADWQKENEQGIIYYLQDNVPRGIMLCNVYEKINEARAMLDRKEPATIENLRGAL
jgi:NAD(P)H-nitrite reductase large subunit